MRDYSNWYPSRAERLKHKAEKNFAVHYDNGDEGKVALINGRYRTKVIIKAHSNPLNEYLEDLKMYYVDSKSCPIRWGDILCNLDGDGHDYLVVTRPESNGFTSKTRIRKMYNKIKFSDCVNDTEHEHPCIMAKGLLYDVTSYVKEPEVFQDEDKIAILVRYDCHTKCLKMFQDVKIDGLRYKIVKIDNYTLKERNENFGILQITLIRAVFGDVYDSRFEVEEHKIPAILRYAQLKERIYNAKAREMLTPHDLVKPGDYITHVFPRNPYSNDNVVDEKDYTETRIYIVKSLVDVRNEYDSCFILNCNASFYLKDDNGEPFLVHAYFEDNATQLMANERNSNVFNENSKFKCTVPENKYTLKLGKEVGRIIIKGDSYTVVGVDKLSAEGVLGVELMEGKLSPSYDNFDLQIADYHKTDGYDTTSDKDFDELYADEQNWTYLVGDYELFLGERCTYKIELEPKIVHNENHILVPYRYDIQLLDDDGNPFEHNDFSIEYEYNSIHIKTDIKVPLLGTKLKLVSKVYFEEQIYQSETDTYITNCKVSSHTKEISVVGW